MLVLHAHTPAATLMRVVYEDPPSLRSVRPDVPARTVNELIALTRANPGKFTYASSGFGASPHLSAEWFKLMTKTDILHVPYTGSAPALPALLGGHVDMMFDTMPSVWPLVLPLVRRRAWPMFSIFQFMPNMSI